MSLPDSVENFVLPYQKHMMIMLVRSFPQSNEEDLSWIDGEPSIVMIS